MTAIESVPELSVRLSELWREAWADEELGDPETWRHLAERITGMADAMWSMGRYTVYMDLCELRGLARERGGIASAELMAEFEESCDVLSDD